MLLPRFSLIYIHIPKTGGNSLQSWLLPLSEDTKKIQAHQDGSERFEITGPITNAKHMTLGAYAQALPQGLEGWRVLTSIRHPFERVISFYFSPHRWFSAGPDGTWQARAPVWDEEAFLHMLDAVNSSAMVKFLTVDGAPQRPDFVVRQSHLACDLNTAAARFGLPVPPELPHLNRSADTTGLRQKLLSDSQLRNFVEDRFREDMDFFGFDSYCPAP